MSPDGGKPHLSSPWQHTEECGDGTFHTTPHIMPTGLDQELIRVVRTLEELQHKYLALLDDESAREDPVETLNDYKVLSEKMLGWIEECDNMTR